MKTTLLNLLAGIIFAASLQAHAQGLVYDQQSATSPISPSVNNSNGFDGINIQSATLFQAFVPALSAIGFVQFEFWDIPNNGTNGATVYVNLWTGSPNINSATLLGSTPPVYMPNGFVNSGLAFAGVTNFYFSSVVTLTPGQTYYLQPVVQSGDNPWDVISFQTYPNGNLYYNGTRDPGGDLWFREGIVSVPEPITLALVGLSSLLVFGFKRHSKLFIPLLFFISILSIHASDSVVQATADEAGLTPVSAKAVPNLGTYWVMTVGPDGNLLESPYPFLPSNLSTLPTYSVRDDIFIVDNTGGQLAPSSAARMNSTKAASTAQSQAESVAGLIDLIQTGGVHAMNDVELSPPGDTNSSGTNQTFQSNFTPHVFGSNDLWLSITSATNGITKLVIHPPSNENSSTDSWNVFYTTNIATPFSNWWWILTAENEDWTC